MKIQDNDDGNLEGCRVQVGKVVGDWMMFKATSDNAQFRTRNAAVNSRRNDLIDDGVFKPEIEPEKTDLQKVLLRKHVLQDQITKINAQIGLARRRFHFGEKGTVHPRTLALWEADRQRIAAEIASIDSLLTIKKVDKSIEHKMEALEYAAIFKEVAKSRLAEPIYKQLCKWASEISRSRGKDD